MPRRIEPDKINLDAYAFEPFVNEKFTGVVIKWDSDIGFGEYTIYKANDSNQWYAQSEHMDSDEDKDFIRELLKLFVERLSITE